MESLAVRGTLKDGRVSEKQIWMRTLYASKRASRTSRNAACRWMQNSICSTNHLILSCYRRTLVPSNLRRKRVASVSDYPHWVLSPEAHPHHPCRTHLRHPRRSRLLPRWPMGQPLPPRWHMMEHRHLPNRIPHGEEVRRHHQAQLALKYNHSEEGEVVELEVERVAEHQLPAH